MLKFLFGGKSRAAKTTQRDTIVALLGDVNAIIDGMSEKPKITIDPNTGAISLDLPEQMPDEALALPAPDPEDEKSPKFKSNRK